MSDLIIGGGGPGAPNKPRCSSTPCSHEAEVKRMRLEEERRSAVALAFGGGSEVVADMIRLRESRARIEEIEGVRSDNAALRAEIERLREAATCKTCKGERWVPHVVTLAAEDIIPSLASDGTGDSYSEGADPCPRCKGSGAEPLGPVAARGRDRHAADAAHDAAIKAVVEALEDLVDATHPDDATLAIPRMRDVLAARASLALARAAALPGTEEDGA
jgi:hypothetical protein